MGYAEFITPTKRGHWLGTNGPSVGMDNTDTLLDLYVELGLNVIRVDCPASWFRDDGQIKRVSEHIKKVVGRGLCPLVLVGYSIGPGWVVQDGYHAAPNETGMTMWAQTIFNGAKKLITAGARACEGWNEYNLDIFFSPHSDAKIYMETQESLYVAWHAAGEEMRAGSVTCITGGTAPAVYRTPQAFTDYLNAGGGPTHRRNVFTFDGVGIHLGMYPHNPWRPPYDKAPWNPFLQAGELRNISKFAGRNNTLIWATECPWPTSANALGSDEAAAARCLEDTKHWFTWQDEGWAGPLLTYHGGRDDQGDTSADNGLLYKTGAKKEKLCAALKAQAAKPFTRPAAQV